MELFLEGFPTHPKFNKKVSEHAFYNIHLPIVHHDPTALVKSGAGIIGERDVTRLCNLSVTLGDVQQKSCTLGRIASLNVTKKTYESYIVSFCRVVSSSTDGRFPGQSSFSSKRINQQLQCGIHITAFGSLLS